MKKPFFYNKDKRNETTKALSEALSGRKTVINNTTPNFGGNGPTQYGSVSTNETTNGSNQTGDFLNNAFKLGSKLYQNWQGGSAGGDTSAVGGALSNFMSDSGGSSSPIMSALTSEGGSGSAIGDAISSNIGSSGGGGGWFSNLFSSFGSSGAGSGAGGMGGLFSSFGSSGGGAGGGGGGTPWGLIGKVAKGGYNLGTGQDDTEYSDLEEGIIYPLQGASTGAQFGPWGALGGALYGLGYGFKDDVGLKDNDWLTTILFPIGMGDEHQGLIQL